MWQGVKKAFGAWRCKMESHDIFVHDSQSGALGCRRCGRIWQRDTSHFTGMRPGTELFAEHREDVGSLRESLQETLREASELTREARRMRDLHVTGTTIIETGPPVEKRKESSRRKPDFEEDVKKEPEEQSAPGFRRFFE